MSRAVAARLRRIERGFGWQHTSLQLPDGAEVTVPTVLLVDAWLRVTLDGDVPDLPPDVSEAVAVARMRPADGAFLLGLREACRDVWFPERRRAQHVQDDEALSDPPTFAEVEDVLSAGASTGATAHRRRSHRRWQR